jgi:hypothetical protein
MTKILVTVGCDPGATTCGRCSHAGLGINGCTVMYQCGFFATMLAEGPEIDDRCTRDVLRCRECLDAERAAKGSEGGT